LPAGDGFSGAALIAEHLQRDVERMKRWIIGLGIVALLVGGFVYYVSSGALNLEFTSLRGETKPAVRKKLSIPIRASGLIEAASPPIEIKSKASGEVAKIPHQAGDLVRKGELLLELDPKDEQRAFDRLQAEFDRAKANLERAQVGLDQMKKDLPADIKMASADIDSAKAILSQMEYQLEHYTSLRSQGNESENSVRIATDNYNQAKAKVAQAEAGVEKLRNNMEDQFKSAEQNVALARADYNVAKKSLEDGEQRLRETKLYAPIDGMITKINVRVGELILSGTQSLTGGSLLMTLADISDLYVTAQVDEADISTVLDLAPVQARPGAQRTEAAIKSGSASAAQSDTPQADAAATQRDGAALTQGKPVKITVEAFREESFQGMIEHVSPEPLRQQSVVTYDVRIKLSSPNRYKLLLGMQADAEFTLEAIDAVVIPVDAVQILDGDTERGSKGERGVWLPVEGDNSIPPKKVWRTCRFGLDDGSEIEVINGVKEGEKVFTKLPVVLEKDKDKDKDNSPR
jgi:HlyD family secretion protein